MEKKCFWRNTPVAQFTSPNEFGQWLSPNSPAGVSRSSPCVKTWGTHLWWVRLLFHLYFSILTLIWMERILPVLGSANSARCLDPPARSLSPRANETNLQRYHNCFWEQQLPSKGGCWPWFELQDATVAPQTDTLALLIFQNEKLKPISGNAESFLNVLKTQSQSNYWRSRFFP